ncbi:hypothetical protein [Nocardia sp. AG03]|uniref:hypothetical protein n=1 Tax=Nocardia sp. AG03 TaxID=3025312 RepID=UPI002418AFB1|nr:hypothetical protein [Nocardia sp. AG03]
MDPTSTTLMLATCVFFLFGLTALASSLPLAISATVGLALAMLITTRALRPA